MPEQLEHDGIFVDVHDRRTLQRLPNLGQAVVQQLIVVDNRAIVMALSCWAWPSLPCLYSGAGAGGRTDRVQSAFRHCRYISPHKLYVIYLQFSTDTICLSLAWPVLGIWLGQRRFDGAVLLWKRVAARTS